MGQSDPLSTDATFTLSPFLILSLSGDKTILTNFDDYRLPRPLDIVRLLFLLLLLLTLVLHQVRCDMGNLAWRGGLLFDAIVCDPPYGPRTALQLKLLIWHCQGSELGVGPQARSKRCQKKRRKSKPPLSPPRSFWTG